MSKNGSLSPLLATSKSGNAKFISIFIIYDIEMIIDDRQQSNQCLRQYGILSNETKWQNFSILYIIINKNPHHPQYVGLQEKGGRANSLIRVLQDACSSKTERAPQYCGRGGLLVDVLICFLYLTFSSLVGIVSSLFCVFMLLVFLCP